MVPFATRRIYGVSEITAEVRSLLEGEFQGVLVEGEISNWTVSNAGHIYFALKDARSQLKCVCFRSKARQLRQRFEDGNQVLVRGSLGVYELRGEYSLYAESIEPRGIGALQIAFDRLKAKLEAEGLFDEARKKPLPVLPRTVGIVTSPTGAAIHDILRTLNRSRQPIPALLFPAKVQGEGAAEEIAAGIHALNGMPEVDLVIVGRGGGSMEDLWAFNQEPVARAIWVSRVPVISAVGHQVDFTISDFVADIRASTPTSAAEMVAATREELATRSSHLRGRLQQILQLRLSQLRNRVLELSANRAFESAQGRIRSQRQWLDEMGFRLGGWTRSTLTSRREFWRLTAERLERFNLRHLVTQRRKALNLSAERAATQIRFTLQAFRARLSAQTGALRSLGPAAVLNRGYSICRDAEGTILKDAARLQAGDPFSVTLSKGNIAARAERIETSRDLGRTAEQEEP
jgi:exodeoxyribonuclease VII large subunit